ncbi:MAG: hypothetical protein KME11_03925 [Timaviella obliquedivisa GSE-PSE-MK23-08B]|nr:hypothetical protein [Timaviella obliquedivisa GSE-PSE-MK23-08B]
MQYPLNLTFKIWTWSPNKVSVTDNQGKLLFMVRQKAFRLKEAITVYGDEQETTSLYHLKADRIIDFSARYNFTDNTGTVIGGVKRKGMQSLWSARYNIFDGGTNENAVLTIQEDNPWVKVGDALLSELPFVGLFSGYFLNPTYSVKRPDGSVVMRLAKTPGFLSRLFTIKKVDQLSDREETQAILSLLMMILLERRRG